MPIFCANCGSEQGFVPEENCNFAFYLCTPCSENWTHLVGTHAVPDEVFWQRVREEQIEKYGRILAPGEIVEVLKDDSSSLSKLCKDRQDFNKQKMT